jgi:integrase
MGDLMPVKGSKKPGVGPTLRGTRNKGRRAGATATASTRKGAPMQQTQTTPTWTPVEGVPGLRQRTNRHGELTFAAYYTDRDTGKQRQRTLSARTLTDAKREQRSLQVENDDGRAVAPSRKTVEAVADELIATMAKQVENGTTGARTLETLEYRLRVVRRLIGKREVQKVTPDTVAKLALNMRGYSAVRRVLSFAVRRGYIAENPCSKLERGERPKPNTAEVVVLPHEDLAKLLRAASGSTRTLIATAALSGLRQSELLALQWSDVDFEAGVLHVRNQLSRGTVANPSKLVPLKTDKSAREVILSDDLADLLREHRKSTLARGLSGPDRFVFSTRNGTPLSHRNAARALTDACDSAGIRRIGFHVLRHGFASTLIVDLGLDPVQVCRQLGHAAPSITLDTYSHLFDRARHGDDLRERIGSSGLAAAVTGAS